MSYGWRTGIAVVGSVVLFALFCVGCFFGHYWLWNHNQNEGARIQSHGYSEQTGYIQQINDDWTAMAGESDFTGPDGNTNRVEYLHQGNDVCFQYSRLTGSIQIAPDIKTWAQQNCDGDAVAANSQYRKGIAAN
jgi:hypothetical protein